MTPEFLLSLLALAVGHGVAVCMVSRRKPVAFECVGGIKQERLRFRPMTTTVTQTDQYALPLEKRYPELSRRLQETALRLAQEKGTITSDDVWDAHPIPAGIEPRIMASAFKPRARWRKTGQYVPTRRPSANRRPIPCWELREAEAA